jgi:hypothetical protein
VPIFQRDETTNGGAAATVPDASGSVQEAAADAGTLPVEPVDQVPAETAETINESYETPDRETQS